MGISLIALAAMALTVSEQEKVYALALEVCPTMAPDKMRQVAELRTVYDRASEALPNEQQRLLLSSFCHIYAHGRGDMLKRLQDEGLLDGQ